MKILIFTIIHLTLNPEHGIRLESSDDINIDNCFASLNGKNEIYFDTVNNINITNVIAKNNNVKDSTYSGIALTNCDNARLTFCQSYDDREPFLQAYGLKLSGTNTGINLLNCKLYLNKNGEIYNPDGEEITVITEKY